MYVYRDRSIASLLLWIFVALIVVGGLVVALVRFAPPTRVLKDPDAYAAVAGFLGVIFGTAAAIGGAVATVKLAALALKISTQQDLRDARTFVDEKIQTAVDSLADVAIALSTLVASGVELHIRLYEYLEAHPLKGGVSTAELEKSLDGVLLDATMQVASSIRELRQALGELHRNGIALRCYTTQLRGENSALLSVNQALSQHGFPESQYFSSDDLTAVVQFLRITERNLSQPRYGKLAEAHLATYLSKYDHASLRAFLFTGNLISMHQVGSCHAAIGAAMLYDIYRSIPDAKSIRTVVADAYREPGVAEAVDRSLVEFSPRSLVGAHFLVAIDALSSQTNLLVHELPV